MGLSGTSNSSLKWDLKFEIIFEFFHQILQIGVMITGADNEIG
jgi:hypothetical protein